MTWVPGDWTIRFAGFAAASGAFPGATFQDTSTT